MLMSFYVLPYVLGYSFFLYMHVGYDRVYVY